jgi:hypothetical protein
MSAPLPRNVIDSDTPQRIARADGMTLYPLPNVAARLHKSPRWLQGYLREQPFGRMAGRTRLFTAETRPPRKPRQPQTLDERSIRQPRQEAEGPRQFRRIPDEGVYKTVVASFGGKTVTRSQGQIVAQQMVKNAIRKGPAATALLLKFIESHEARHHCARDGHRFESPQLPGSRR